MCSTKELFDFDTNYFHNLNNLTTSCARQLKIFQNSLINGENWALRMMDASSKPNSGYLDLNIAHYGSFDECMKLEVDTQTQNNTIYGKYCLIMFNPNILFKPITNKFNKSLNLFDETTKQFLKLYPRKSISIPTEAVCVPNECVQNDVKMLMHNNFYENIDLHDYHIVFCQSILDYPKTDWLDVAVIILFVLIIVINIYFTIYVQCGPDNISGFCKIFSLEKNLREVFSASKSPISCLEGIRTISIIMIIFYHVFLYDVYTPNFNENIVMKFWYYNPLATFFDRGRNAVETFFFLSSFLVMYNFQNMVSNKRKFNLWRFYGNRYFRLFPVVIIVFLFYITLGKFCGQGPLYPDYLHDIEVWRKYAWTQFICIGNFFLKSDRSFSLAHLWYVHCDTQLYLFTPIVFLFYLKFSKKSCLVIMCFALLMSICTILTCGYLITARYNVKSAEYSFLYKMPYFRANSWIMGLLCAYFYTKMKNSPFNLNKIAIYCGWIISVIIFLFGFFGEFPLKFCDDCASLFIYYDTFENILWCLAIYWIIIFCFHEANGLMNNFLSCYIFRVWSRLSYSMYVVHNLIIFYYYNAMRTSPTFSLINLLDKCIFFLFLSTILAIILTIFVEKPIVKLMNKILNKL